MSGARDEMIEAIIACKAVGLELEADELEEAEFVGTRKTVTREQVERPVH
jgi:hypothetical protein